MKAGGGGRVVSGQLLQDTDLIEGESLVEAVTDFAEQVQGPATVGGGGRVVPGQPLHGSDHVDGESPAVLIAEVAVELEGLLEAVGGGRVLAGLNAQLGQAFEDRGLAGWSPRSRNKSRACWKLSAAAG